MKTIVLLLTQFSGECDIDQIDAGVGGVSMEQFQRLYVQQRSGLHSRAIPKYSSQSHTDFPFVPGAQFCCAKQPCRGRS